MHNYRQKCDYDHHYTEGESRSLVGNFVDIRQSWNIWEGLPLASFKIDFF